MVYNDADIGTIALFVRVILLRDVEWVALIQFLFGMCHY